MNERFFFRFVLRIVFPQVPLHIEHPFINSGIHGNIGRIAP
jgi:hypothetical protein